MNFGKMMKVTAAALCLSAAAAGLTGCGGVKASSAAESGKMKVVIGTGGTATNWAQMKQGSNDVSGLEGFCIDLWNEIGKRNDWQIEYRLGEFVGLWGMLDNDQIDSIAANVSESPERRQKYIFSEPFYVDNSVFVYKPSQGEAKDLDFFKGKKIGVGAPTTSRLVLEDLDAKHNLGIEQVNLDREGDVIASVLSGMSEAGIMDKSTANLTIFNLKADLKVYDPQYRIMGSAMPLKKNDRGKTLEKGINTAIESMKKDGSLKKLSEKWLHDDLSKMPKDFWGHWDQDAQK